MARVVIAEDHALTRAGVRSALERRAGEFRVVAEAADMQATVAAVAARRPQLLVLDLSMPDGSSLTIMPALLHLQPALAIAVLTMHDEPRLAREALRRGARAFVLKNAEPLDLLKACRAALAGREWLPPHIGPAVLKLAEAEAADPLSERERAVVRGIALNMTYKQIAGQIGIGERTVKTYRTRAAEKLGVRSHAELTAYALERRLLDGGPPS